MGSVRSRTAGQRGFAGFFCGRVLDPSRYDEILRERGLRQTDYFPAYRQGEFL